MSVDQGQLPPIVLTLSSPNPTVNMVLARICIAVVGYQKTDGPRIRAFRMDLSTPLSRAQIKDVSDRLYDPERFLRKRARAIVTQLQYFGRTNEPGGRLTLVIDTHASDLVLSPAPMPN